MINKAWHLKNKMPKTATLEQKIKWHTGHAKNCQCRDSKAHLVQLKKRLPKAAKVCRRGHTFQSPGPCPLCWPGSLKRVKK